MIKVRRGAPQFLGKSGPRLCTEASSETWVHPTAGLRSRSTTAMAMARVPGELVRISESGSRWLRGRLRRALPIRGWHRGSWIAGGSARIRSTVWRGGSDRTDLEPHLPSAERSCVATDARTARTVPCPEIFHQPYVPGDGRKRKWRANTVDFPSHAPTMPKLSRLDTPRYRRSARVVVRAGVTRASRARHVPIRRRSSAANGGVLAELRKAVEEPRGRVRGVVKRPADTSYHATG